MPGKIGKIFKDEPKEDFGKFAYEKPEEKVNEEKEVNDYNNDEVLKNLEIQHEDFDEDESDDGYEISSYDANDNATHYNIGRYVNVTVNEDESAVNVNLDQNTLREIFSGNF